MHPKQLTTAARKIAALARAGQFSGTVLIRQGETDLLCRSYGLAHRGWGIRNTPTTRYRIASVGKLFTAAAVLKQIDAGRLALDTPVVQALGLTGTSLPPAATLEHFLSMTSGIADWIDEEAEDFDALWAQFCREHPLYQFRANSDYLPIFANLAPLSPPGQIHRYNGAGFILLGLLLEKVSGLSYFDLIQRDVFSPAGMAHSGFPALDDVVPNLAEGYLPGQPGSAGSGWRKNIYAATAGAAADGGATSTTHDLARFMQALRAGRLCSPDLAAAMRAPGVLVNGEDFLPNLLMYGFGCFILVDPYGKIVRWGHTGEEEGISCRVFHYPKAEVDLVILGNQSGCAGQVLRLLHPLLAQV